MQLISLGRARLNNVLRHALSSRKQELRLNFGTLRLQSRVEVLLTTVTENGSVRVGRWKCGQCTAIFDSKKALSVDSRHQHAYCTVLKRFVFGDECLVCGKIFLPVPDSWHMSDPPSIVEALMLTAFPRQQMRWLKVHRRLTVHMPRSCAPKAGYPLRLLYLQSGCLGLYCLLEALIGNEEGLDGFLQKDIDNECSDDTILPFLYQSSGGSKEGKRRVYQQFGLAAEAARRHITCYVFVHFYSGFRRHGDLQHHTEMQAAVTDAQIFCISIDLCLAKANSDHTCGKTKAFWVERMRSGQA